MPDFGRWTSNGGDPSLNEINRVDRFFDALGSEETAYSTDHAEAELAFLLADWRDDVRDAPPTVQLTGRDVVAALNEGLGRRRGRSSLALVASTAAAVLCIGGFGAAIYGAGPGDTLYGMHTTLFGGEAARDDQVVLSAQTEMLQVQQLIDQGQWQQAQDKLVALSPQVQSVDTPEQKQQLTQQFNALTYKVAEQDPAATLPPPSEPQPVLSNSPLTLLPVPVVVTPTSPSSSSSSSTTPTSPTSPSDSTSPETVSTSPPSSETSLPEGFPPSSPSSVPVTVPGSTLVSVPPSSSVSNPPSSPVANPPSSPASNPPSSSVSNPPSSPASNPPSSSVSVPPSSPVSIPASAPASVPNSAPALAPPIDAGASAPSSAPAVSAPALAPSSNPQVAPVQPPVVVTSITPIPVQPLAPAPQPQVVPMPEPMAPPAVQLPGFGGSHRSGSAGLEAPVTTVFPMPR